MSCPTASRVLLQLAQPSIWRQLKLLMLSFNKAGSMHIVSKRARAYTDHINQYFGSLWPRDDEFRRQLRASAVLEASELQRACYERIPSTHRRIEAMLATEATHRSCCTDHHLQCRCRRRRRLLTSLC